MKPTHPGAFIRNEILADLELTTERAADILGVDSDSLADLLHERISLSPEMALRVEMAFGLSLETLLRLQARFDAWAIRRRADEIEVRRYKPR
ncbi:HigA family addiction module antitoxin [Geminicoccus harenae]|uniref:HigA family addiction module antitoxin n=1 Tax=Geminicoccus harenae TaxID=2498453 RepID=UPI00168B28B4|nr:HigA family addiction module antitoxin [Geminicoccus harenae]